MEQNGTLSKCLTIIFEHVKSCQVSPERSCSRRIFVISFSFQPFGGDFPRIFPPNYLIGNSERESDLGTDQYGSNTVDSVAETRVKCI